MEGAKNEEPNKRGCSRYVGIHKGIYLLPGVMRAANVVHRQKELETMAQEKSWRSKVKLVGKKCEKVNESLLLLTNFTVFMHFLLGYFAAIKYAHKQQAQKVKVNGQQNLPTMRFSTPLQRSNNRPQRGSTCSNSSAGFGFTSKCFPLHVGPSLCDCE